jgi:hypothetical protein
MVTIYDGLISYESERLLSKGLALYFYFTKGEVWPSIVNHVDLDSAIGILSQ